MKNIMMGWDKTNPLQPIARELLCSPAGVLFTSAGAPAAGGPPPPLPAGAATEADQQAQTAQLAAINAATTELAVRSYNTAAQVELAPGQSRVFKPGQFHALRWSVQPTDRNAPDLNQRASVDIDGAPAFWYANQNGEVNCTQLNASTVQIAAGSARVTLVWEF